MTVMNKTNKHWIVNTSLSNMCTKRVVISPVPLLEVVVVKGKKSLSLGSNECRESPFLQ